MSVLPPLDAHAHIDPSVSKRDLENLGAVVLIATRSLVDFELVRDRDDLVSVWGVGCHPSLVGAQKAFDPIAFRAAALRTPFIAEVGLDGSSRVPLETQKKTLRAILDTADDLGRIVSLHSFGATSELIQILDTGSQRLGFVLHWWLGDRASTQRAIALGCYFSINVSMTRYPDVLNEIPLDRVLVETDHPSGDRFSSRPRLPGRVQDVEVALARKYGIGTRELRETVWNNFAALAMATKTSGLMPEPVQRMLRSLRPGSN